MTFYQGYAESVRSMGLGINGVALDRAVQFWWTWIKFSGTKNGISNKNMEKRKTEIQDK